jgi:hypothetical protein
MDHYLGAFFQEKLSLDVDLFSGRGQVKDVILNLNVNLTDNNNNKNTLTDHVRFLGIK